MKRHLREIGIVLVVVLILLGGIIYFYRTMQMRKQTEGLDLYTLVAANPQVVMQLNRPQLVSSLMFSNPAIVASLETTLPDVFLSLIKQSPSQSSSLLSIHRQGALFYMKAEENTRKKFETEVFDKYFPAYPPTQETRGDITYTYYADTASRFFGYYHHEGILVASYQLKLLEEVAARQKTNAANRERPFAAEEYPVDNRAPMNLFLSAAEFGLHFPVNDSLTWQAQKEWIATDLFTNEGRICCNGQFALTQTLDSLTLTLAADTLSRQIERYFPLLRIEGQITQEIDVLHYTGCTTNPS